MSYGREETGPEAGSLWRNTLKVLRIVWPDIKYYLIGLTILTTVSAFMPIFGSGVMALLVNDLVAAISKKPLLYPIGLLITLVIMAKIVPELIGLSSDYLRQRSQLISNRALELVFLKKRAEIDVANYDRPRFNDLLRRSSERGIFPLLRLINGQIEGLRRLLQVFIASAALLVIDWRIIVAVAIAALPELWVEWKYGEGIWCIFDINAEKRRQYETLRGHFFSGNRVSELRRFGNVHFFIDRITNFLTAIEQEQRREETKRFLWQIVSALTSLSVMTFILVTVINGVVSGKIQIGSMTFIFAAAGSLAGSCSSFFSGLGQLNEQNRFASDLLALLDVNPVIESPRGGVIINGDQAPEIVFDHVTFQYPESDTAVIKDLTCIIRSGDKIALVGENGCGKSTLIKLICRDYDPTVGRILVNGHDLREIDLSSWRRKIGVLTQNFDSYQLKTNEAIWLGRSDQPLDMNLITKAGEESDADHFIRKWKDGYLQQLGKEFTGGINPSHGQNQKLALARIFYRQADLTILDEPTASIDAAAEAAIFRQLESWPRDKTVIIVSHRFSTVRQANTILVLSEGQLIEVGDHETLTRLGGTYARLYELQAQGYR